MGSLFCQRNISIVEFLWSCLHDPADFVKCVRVLLFENYSDAMVLISVLEYDFRLC